MAVFILKQVLSNHFVLLKTWGYRYYIIIEEIFSNSLFWANQIDPASPIIMTPCLQSGIINNHEPALGTIMNRRWQQSWPRIISFYNPTMVVIINRQVLHLQAGWISVEYLKDQYFCQVRALKADSKGLFLIIFLYKSQCQQMDCEAGLLTQIFQEKISRT